MDKSYKYQMLSQEQLIESECIDGCFRYGLYFIYRSLLEENRTVYKRFIGGIGYELTQKDETIVSLRLCKKTYFDRDYSIVKQLFEKDLEGALLFIKDSIDKGRYVSVRTVQEAVPFFKWYNPLYRYDKINVKNYDKHHRFLIIGEDKLNYFFIDHPDNLKKDKCVIETDDKIVKKVEKKVLYKAFGQLMEAYTIHVNKIKLLDNLARIPDILPKIFRDAVELYYADSCESDEKYFGRRCWIQLLKNCNLGTVSIIGSNPNENPRLVIGLVNMIKRRELLLKTIDQTEVLRNKYAFVMDALIQDITILTLTKNNMLREIFRGQKYMDNNIRNMVKRILEAEDMLHITLLKV